MHKNNYITLKALAKMLGITRPNLTQRVRRDKVETVLAPVMTVSGPKQARWVPEDYAMKLVSLYEQAKANTKE